MKWRSLQESHANDLRPLREIFAERKSVIAQYAPPDTQAIHAQAVAQLKVRGLAADILPVRRRLQPLNFKTTTPS